MLLKQPKTLADPWSRSASIPTEVLQRRLKARERTGVDSFRRGFWLVIIFLCCSLLVPPNAPTALDLITAAFSVVGAVCPISEPEQPPGGSLRISSVPMTRNSHHLEQ